MPGLHRISGTKGVPWIASSLPQRVVSARPASVGTLPRGARHGVGFRRSAVSWSSLPVGSATRVALATSLSLVALARRPSTAGADFRPHRSVGNRACPD
ncbi:hypothetical protein GLE_0073 [Lysobacter enzymogenes]|uniref:Uncharacterized protein n=1 Tax=Lysobacter enzymogenes TaxID=69 RepID=A0A0S2DAT6_LYSEN|nr:hypothetical protein GLE_0073 [Lysobacter enzymogenes]